MNEINYEKPICSYLDLSHLITLGITVAMGFIGVAAVTWFLSNNIPKFALVDTQVLIAKQSEQLAANARVKDPRVGTHLGKVSASQVQEAGNLLKEKLELFAAKNRVILFNKGAVMGGHLPDYTESIVEDLFPDDAPSLRKLIEENAKFRKQARSIFPRLFSNKQQENKQP